MERAAAATEVPYDGTVIHLEHRTPDLADLYQEHYAAVLGVARARLGCPETAADVAQETFARAAQSTASGIPMPNARAWLLRTARNLCVDHWRAQQRLAQLPVDLAADELSQPEATMLRAADAQRLHSALLGLSPKLRSALISRDIERQPVGQIAESLGVTVESASVLLHRARTRVRRAYEKTAGALVPPGLLDFGRRWLGRMSATGQPFAEGANAMCASACAVVLAFAVTVAASGSGRAAAAVDDDRAAPMPAAVHRADAAARSAGAEPRQTNRTASAAPSAARRPAISPPSGGGGTADSPRGVNVPGTPVWASDERPSDREPSIRVEVDEEVAGTRIHAGTEVYADDVALPDR